MKPGKLKCSDEGSSSLSEFLEDSIEAALRGVPQFLISGPSQQA